MLRVYAYLRLGAKVVGLAVMGLALTLACALATAWWWSGTEGSLAQTLQSLAPNGLLNRLATQAGVSPGQLSIQGVKGNRWGAVRPLWGDSVAAFPGARFALSGLAVVGDVCLEAAQ